MADISRRTFVKFAGIGALGIGLSSVLASCGNGSPASEATEAYPSVSAAGEAAKDQVIVTMTVQSPGGVGVRRACP